MAFPSDARNHYKAIDSELNLSNYRSQIENIFDKKIEKFVHLGGTKNKVDVLIIFCDNTTTKVSLKNKKNIKSGSFDWVNTTKFSKINFKKSFDIFNKYKGVNEVKYKKLLEEEIKEELKNIESNELTQLFVKNVVNLFSEDNLNLLIIDEKTKKIYLVEPKIFNLIKKGYKLEIEFGRGKTSAKVLCVDENGDKIDLGLRIRFHLNNGWSKWHKGESSVPCLKFQQDKVYKMLNL